ncbi:MAG: hypothetical protein R3D29_11025 [Nitratireductor sp.]
MRNRDAFQRYQRPRLTVQPEYGQCRCTTDIERPAYGCRIGRVLRRLRQLQHLICDGGQFTPATSSPANAASRMLTFPRWPLWAVFPDAVNEIFGRDQPRIGLARRSEGRISPAPWS